MSATRIGLAAATIATICVGLVIGIHVLPTHVPRTREKDVFAGLSVDDVVSAELQPLYRVHGSSGLFTINAAVRLTDRSKVQELITSMQEQHDRGASLPPMKHWTPDRDVKLLFLLQDSRCIAFRVSLLPAYGVASYEEFQDPNSRLALDPVRSTNRGSDVIYDLIDQAVRGSCGWVAATNVVER